ncbi:MAG TPA: IclR family transcriptional regulator, partial [Acidisoma sp.]|uniref:IclR family transcriptional regulator n=1 Tax=Acidisoma sp. TaxID=1872115 RepID=UPI002BEABD65
DVPGTAVISKVMRLLQAISDAPSGTTVAELCRATGYPRPTVHRLLGVLAQEGMVGSEGLRGRVLLGPRLVSLAYRAWHGSDLRRRALPHLAALRDETDETVHLAVPSAGEMVYIDKLESRRAVRMASRIGTRVSLHSSSVGKAFLASLPETESEALIANLAMPAFTPHTLTDQAALKAEIAATRRRGYATDLQENELDICCYGGAIRGVAGSPIGCISISMPRYRFESQDPTRFAEALHRCTGNIAAAMLSPASD